MSPEQLFARFRSTGDPGDLGAVFDLCADDLFAVALHVCPDRAAAEDVLQATFLVAMQRAKKYAPQRPLRPWLLGILHREAKRARRRAQRRPDAERLAARAEPAPPHALAAKETIGVVQGAIVNVPQPYRAVLDLHLVQSLPTSAIAERLRRSPGAVRTQLWRGLEKLRRLLPPGLALGVAGELTMLPALAAVREKVVAAAASSSAAAGIGTMVVIGGVAVKKAVIAISIGLAVGLMWWQSRAVVPLPDLAPPTATDEARSIRADSRSVGSNAPAATANDRMQVARAAQPAAPLEQPVMPALVQSCLVLVVDGAGDPVADAGVAVFAVRTEDGQGLSAENRASNDPIARLLTDYAGRCQVRIERPVVLSASKPGVGWSGDIPVHPEALQRDGDRRIVLLPTATVMGRIELPDGRPGAGLTVVGSSHDFAPDRSDRLPATESDERGAFRFEVLAGIEYSIGSRWNGRHARGGQVPELSPGAEFEVTLRFPGAFSVSGILHDAKGEPTAGRAWLIRRDGIPPDDLRGAHCGEDGRFEFLLTAPGEFDLVGGFEGQTAAHVPLALSEVRPHRDITLRTSAFVAASGVVVDERGEPVAGVQVGIGYAVERDRVHVQRSALQGGLPGGSTAADGTFGFQVPANYRLQLVCRPLPGNRELIVRGPIFMSPATGLVMTVRESDKQGFMVSGRVVAAATGEPVPSGEISLRTIRRNGSSSMGSIGEISDGAFEVGPIAAGKRCSLEFRASGLAPFSIGPYDTSVRHERVTVRLPELGKVRCRVQRADGTPAVQVFASLQQEVYDPFGRAWQGKTDAQGRIEFTEVTPGNFTVHARADADAGGKAVKDIVVVSGQTSEVDLVLQK